MPVLSVLCVFRGVFRLFWLRFGFCWPSAVRSLRCFGLGVLRSGRFCGILVVCLGCLVGSLGPRCVGLLPVGVLRPGSPLPLGLAVGALGSAVGLAPAAGASRGFSLRPAPRGSPFSFVITTLITVAIIFLVIIDRKKKRAIIEGDYYY